MTTDQGIAAGPELDNRVAREVMGWEWKSTADLNFKGKGSGWRGLDANAYHGPVFSPSTSMSDAWRAIEELQGRGYTFDIQIRNGIEAYKIVVFGPQRLTAAAECSGDHMPAVICRAVLTAVARLT